MLTTRLGVNREAKEDKISKTITRLASCLASDLNISPITTGITCEFSKKLLGRDIGEAVEVPAIAMATVWLIRLLASLSASSPVQPIVAPCGAPGRPHWLWDSSKTEK